MDAVVGLATKRGHLQRAVSLLGAVDAMRRVINAPRMRAERSRFDGYLEEIRQQLSQEAFTIAWQKGLQMSLQQAIALGLEEVEK